jgi:hypothetical protein
MGWRATEEDLFAFVQYSCVYYGMIDGKIGFAGLFLEMWDGIGVLPAFMFIYILGNILPRGRGKDRVG